MLIDSGQIKKVLSKVRVAQEHLDSSSISDNSQILDVGSFHRAIEEIYNLTIEMVKVSFQADHLRGKVERYEGNRARILIKAQQAAEFIRFVTVKELCHLMIDETDDWSSHGVDTITGLQKEWQLIGENGTGHEDPVDSLKSEMLAEIAAIEMVYRRTYRANDVIKIRAQETTIAKIALEHDIPEYAVDHALRHNDILESCWTELEKTLGN